MANSKIRCCYLATLALAAAPFAAALSISDLQRFPKCAQQPASDLFLKSGCGLDDTACICKNQGFQDGLTTAVMSDCSPEDQQTVLKVSTDICSEAGIQVNVPQTTAAAAAATEPSTPPEAPPPPESTSEAPPPPESTSEAPPPEPSSEAPPPEPSSEAPPPESSSPPPSTSNPPPVSSSSIPSPISPPFRTPIKPQSPPTSYLIAPAFANVLTGTLAPSYTAYSAPVPLNTASAPSIVAGPGSASGLVTASPPYPYSIPTGVVPYNGTNGTNYNAPVPFLGAAPRNMGVSLYMASGLTLGVLGLFML